MEKEKSNELEPGFIYLIEATGLFKPGTVRCKLGKSINKEERLNQLRRAQPCTTYEIIDSLLCNNITKTEQLFHRRYREYNANLPNSKEWFDFPPEVLAQVKKDFRELETNRTWTPLPPLVDPKNQASAESVSLNPAQFLSLNQNQELLSQGLNQESPRNQRQEPSSQSPNHPENQINQPQQVQTSENPRSNQSQEQSQNQNPSTVEAEIVDEEEYLSPKPVTESTSVNNIFIFMNDTGQLSQGGKRRNFIGGLVMTAFLGLLAIGSLFQGSAPVPASVNVGETIQAGLVAAGNNNPNQARELFRNLQSTNGECEVKLGESLVAAVEQSKSSDEFYQLADKPLRLADEQGCIQLR